MSAATLLIVVVTASTSSADISTLLLVALVATGVMGNAERLGAAAESAVMAKH